jgi:hypothetical protein
MNFMSRLIVTVGVMVLSACGSTFIKNSANTECERRVQADRERCLKNVNSSDEALQARKAAKRDSARTLKAPTREDLEIAEDKRAP